MVATGPQRSSEPFDELRSDGERWIHVVPDRCAIESPNLVLPQAAFGELSP